MIHRINFKQDRFISLTSDPKDQRLLNNFEVEPKRFETKTTMEEIDDSKSVDEGPTIGVLEPEMFAGVETIVVPSEPDLTNYNSVELSSINEEKTKFQFSGNNNVTFHRRFPQIDPQENLIDYYSCALQADILLQGHLYITENYFAFYSNILGLYKTKILIPVCEVLDITKEKTAIIIPNAVGIETHEGKYVFASLLSRETTYRLMVEVWKNTISRDSFQMDTFPYDRLRTVQGGTTDNSSPSTPTTEEALKSLLPEVKSDSGLSVATLKPLDLEIVAKSASIKSNKLVRRSKVTRSGFQNCSDTSTPETASDLDYAQDEDEVNGDRISSRMSNSKEMAQRKSKSAFKVNSHENQSKKRTLVFESWKRLSLLIKSFRDKLKSDLKLPFLHIAIIILLTYLLISTVCMIHRINLLQELFDSLTSNPKAQRMLDNLQVEQIRIDLSANMVKMDDLKSSLLHLLDSVEKVFNSDCANPKTNMFMKPSVLNTCPVKK